MKQTKRQLIEAVLEYNDDAPRRFLRRQTNAQLEEYLIELKKVYGTECKPVSGQANHRSPFGM